MEGEMKSINREIERMLTTQKLMIKKVSYLTLPAPGIFCHIMPQIPAIFSKKCRFSFFTLFEPKLSLKSQFN